MSTSRRSDSREAGRQIVVRIGVLVIVMVVVIVLAMVGGRSSYEIGSRPVVYDGRARNFIGNGRIRIIDYGLEAGRGLAYDSNTDRLFFADAWDAIQVCRPQRSPDNAIEKVSCHEDDRLPKTNICPDGECVPVDLGGLVLDADGHLLVAIRHQRRLLLRDLNQNGIATNFGSVIRGDVHDAASVAPGIVVVGETVEEVSDDGRRRQVGRLFEVGAEKPVPIDVRVARPVGLAYSQDRQRLYVADIDNGSERWRFYVKNAAGNWIEAGMVWTEQLPSGEREPSLQSMVVVKGTVGACAKSTSPECEAIFAAGPQGLYVFDPDGGLLAKYLVGGGVTGLALSPPKGEERESELFMTLGRRLAVLKISALLARNPIELSVQHSASPAASAEIPPKP
jgi:sugar lactone lactonase YvrE